MGVDWEGVGGWWGEEEETYRLFLALHGHDNHFFLWTEASNCVQMLLVI